MHAEFAAEPFQINVPDTVLTDLKERLARTRWPIEPQGRPWQYGTDLNYLRDVVSYWRDGYDWRQWERALNRFAQYRAPINGRHVHFIFERGSGDDPLLLLLTHGWPGSIVEFLDIIEPLAHPEKFGGDVRDAFSVVVPSLPGYGFSDPPLQPISPRDVAALWRTLMVEVLGCERFVAQGGDWGSCVTSWLAVDHPDVLAAIHLNTLGLMPWRGEGAAPMTADEQEWLAKAMPAYLPETGYQQIQGTKPQTLSYALTDSPAGLAGWILEKFHGWTIPGAASRPPFGLDHLLTNIMLYWLNGPNAASWLYVSLVEGSALQLARHESVRVPTRLLLFPNDLLAQPPDSYISRIYDQAHRRNAPSGGHFAALEKGAQLMEDIRAFFRPYRHQ